MAPLLALLLLLLLAVPPSSSQPQQDGVRCLRGLKESLADPTGALSSWDLSNSSVCSFTGVSCWNDQENRILSLSLSSLSLSGTLPSSLRFCSAANHLDLSSNSLSGPIPSELCSWLPYLVSLDLSHNSLSGDIPHQLSGCQYLNKLLLSSNSLSGQIPPEFSSLSRLTEFSVASNSLSGSIPSALAKFGSDSFDGNSGLCGSPLGKCGGLSRTSLIIIIAAGVFGALVSMLLGFLLWRWFLVRPRAKGAVLGGRGGSGRDSRWAERLRPHRLVQVSLFHKPIVKVKLADLMAATNEFDEAHVISTGRSGTVYRVVLRDGSALAVKRVRGCEMSEKHFRSEMGLLGQLRHPNLVPLLGYCIAEDERLLVYKYMPGGSLSSVLHSQGGEGTLDWAVRLKIGIGAARGLAWLHHGIQPALIHQNLCTNVVLLDEDFEPRITDFGLSKLVKKTGDTAKTSAFKDGDFGELGYVAPEYSSTMMASLKGDVYAFGVILLELATGRKPLEVGEVEGGFKGNLVDWVNLLSSNGRLDEAIDRSLLSRGHDNEVMQLLKIALGCVVARPKDRFSMYKVYQALKEMGQKHDGSEHYDEFPLVFGKDDAAGSH